MVITTEQEYEAALKQLEELMRTADDVEFPKELVDAIYFYEEEHYPILPVTQDLVDRAREAIDGVGVDLDEPLKEEDE